jgi:hypothetical protein
MKRFILVFLLSFTFAHSTSLTFDQNLVSDNTFSSFDNSSASSPNIGSIAITGSVAFLGQKLFESGFLEPLGFTPQRITNLSPLAYNKRAYEMNYLTFAPDCEGEIKNMYLTKEVEKDYLKTNYNIVEKCNKLFFIESENNRRSLLNRYSEDINRSINIDTKN